MKAWASLHIPTLRVSCKLEEYCMLVWLMIVKRFVCEPPFFGLFSLKCLVDQIDKCTLTKMWQRHKTSQQIKKHKAQLRDSRESYWLCPKWHPIPYVVRYFSPGPIGFWSNVVHYARDWVPFGIADTVMEAEVNVASLDLFLYFFKKIKLPPFLPNFVVSNC